MSAPAASFVRVSRVLPAPPERVFRAWTTPEELKHWWGRFEEYEIASVEMDVRVGGDYRIEAVGPGPRGVISGTYREVSPSERLAFTFTWDEPKVEGTDIGETLVTVDMKAVDGGTEVVILHEPLTRPAELRFHEFGWRNTLERMDALVWGEG